MMYNHKLAVALKSAGKVLREFGETVYTPYNSEYSILIKNLNSVRALVKIEIDGVDVGDGTKFIIDPNSDVELERFIKNSNLNNGNKFKFIERTESIENHRGINVGDGLVRIEFNFEKVVTLTPYLPWNNHNQWNNNPWYGGNNPILRGTSSDLIGSVSVTNCNTQPTEAGITVPGSVSNQQFQTGSTFPLELETHVIVLQMLGETENNQQVVQAVTVKTKTKCITCGRTNKATANFCTECGTSLTIV